MTLGITIEQLNALTAGQKYLRVKMFMGLCITGAISQIGIAIIAIKKLSAEESN